MEVLSAATSRDDDGNQRRDPRPSLIHVQDVEATKGDQES